MATRFHRSRSIACGGLLLAMLAGIASVDGREPRSAAAGREVDLFQAMADDLIEVQFIPRNSKQAKLIVKNKADQPLSVRLPATFAGVPVLGQGGFGGPGGGGAGGFGGGRNGGAGGQTGGQSQGVGGGFGGGGLGGGGLGGGGLGGGGGLFNIAPEKTARINAHCVCLEHGKDEPRAKIPYEIRPVGEFTDNVEVQELLRVFATGEVNQRIAQAAAWHLADGLSWQQLAAKQIEHVGRPNEPYFHPLELRAAAQLASAARIQARQRLEAEGDAQTREVRSDSDSLAAR